MTASSSTPTPQVDSLASIADMGLPARAVRVVGGLWLVVMLLLGGAVLAGRAAPAHAGGLIVYVSNQDVQRVSSNYRGGSWEVGNIEIFLLHLEQGLSRNLTRSARTDHRPTLSPDGGMIAFESERDGNPEIYLMSVNGGPAINLTRHEAADTTPTWSPDGNFIAFLSWRDGGGSLYLMNPLGQNVRRLTALPGSDIWSPVWSPDGRHIAFITWHVAQLDIAVLTLPDDLATSAASIRYLTDDEATDLSPAWSPDGNRIAFASTHNDQQAIYVIDAEGSAPVRLAPGGNPVWSPDGGRIVFERWVDDIADVDLFVMDADGGNVRNLTHSPNNDAKPAWSPDGTRILFQSWRDGNAEIYVMGDDGSHPRRLTEYEHDDWEAQWVP